MKEREQHVRNKLRLRLPMTDLLSSPSALRVIEQQALAKASFPPLAACSTYFLDDGWSDQAVLCAAQFCAADELQRLAMCQARTKKERCVDDLEAVQRRVKERVTAYQSALRLSEGETRARRHCGFLDLTDLSGPETFYGWFCCMAPLVSPDETAAVVACRDKGGKCDREVLRLTRRVLESNYRFLAVQLHERDSKN